MVVSAGILSLNKLLRISLTIEMINRLNCLSATVYSYCMVYRCAWTSFPLSLVWHVSKQLDTRIFIIAEAVVLLWFSVARFAVRVSVTFHLTCVHISYSSGSVAEWPFFGK